MEEEVQLQVTRSLILKGYWKDGLDSEAVCGLLLLDGKD